ncbi:MAG: hypothetical protein QW100_03480 [Thermoplasmatales archaeon]
MTIISGNYVRSKDALSISFTSGVDSISTDIHCSWSWRNELNGIVSWNFVNDADFQETAVLFRNGYYFGNSYWPVYLENSITSWATKLSPLVQKSQERNYAPLGIVDFGNGRRIVAFLFTLSPGQEWSILEGGFSRSFPPMNPVVYGTKFQKVGKFCIGYDERQVEDWDRQLSTNEKGYSPNPSEVETVEVRVSAYASYVQLFSDDLISDEPCSSVQKKVVTNRGSGDDIEDIIGNLVRIIRSI